MNKEYKSILELNYKLPNIDEKTLEGIKKYPHLFRGHVRTFMGKLYKSGEFEKRSDDILGKELP